MIRETFEEIKEAVAVEAIAEQVMQLDGFLSLGRRAFGCFFLTRVWGGGDKIKGVDIVNSYML